MVVLICMSVMVSDIEQLYFHIPVGGGWWCLVAQSCLTLLTPWTASYQASLSFIISRSLLKPISIESVMPSNHLILCHPFLLLPSISPSIRVFSTESALRIRWPKDWSFSFSISPSSEYIIQYLSFILRLISLSTKPSTCIHVAANGKILIFSPMAE